MKQLPLSGVIIVSIEHVIATPFWVMTPTY